MDILLKFEPDQELSHLLYAYSNLVWWNNNSQLPKIEESAPLNVVSATQVVDLSPKFNEVMSKTNKAALQLSGFYDTFAETNPYFQPYWNQTKTFSDKVDEFPQVKKRKMFQKAKTYAKEMDLEGRVELNNQLDKAFRPLFRGLDVKEIRAINKGIGYKGKEDSIYEKFSPSALGIFGTIAFGAIGYTSPPVFKIISGALGSTCLIGCLLLNYDILRQTDGWFISSYVGRQIKSKSEKADEVISLIKEYSKQ